MTNIISENINKEIPKNLKDCCKTDSLTQNLWIWCERLEKWGFCLCILLGIIGIIDIIINGIQMSNLLNELNIHTDEIQIASAKYNIDIKSVFDVVSEGILTWILYCFIEYASFRSLSLLIGSLASIVHHTRISANVALYNMSIQENNTIIHSEQSANQNVYCQCENEFEESNKTEPIHKWFCDSCKRMRAKSPCEFCGKE